MSEVSSSGTGLTKLFKAFNNGSGSKLPAMLLAILTGVGGTGVGMYSKLEVHSAQIEQLKQDIKEIKDGIKEILRRM